MLKMLKVLGALGIWVGSRLAKSPNYDPFENRGLATVHRRIACEADLRVQPISRPSNRDAPRVRGRQCMDANWPSGASAVFGKAGETVPRNDAGEMLTARYRTESRPRRGPDRA